MAFYAQTHTHTPSNTDMRKRKFKRRAVVVRGKHRLQLNLMVKVHKLKRKSFNNVLCNAISSLSNLKFVETKTICKSENHFTLCTDKSKHTLGTKVYTHTNIACFHRSSN